jgi:tetratricopeptide (TPR) repeat protein
MIAAKQAEIVRQRNEAHRHEARARHIVDDMYTRLSERWLTEDPGDAELRREFLGKAAAYYEELASAPAMDRGTRLEAAHAWLRVGQIGWTLRRTSEAEAALHRAIALFAELADDALGDSSEARDGQAWALIRLGDLLFVAGRNPEAEVFYSRAIELTRSIVAHHPDHLAGWLNLGNAQVSLGDLLEDDALLNQAEATYRKVISDLVDRRADVRPIAEQLLKYRSVVALFNPGSIARAIGDGVDPRQAILPDVHYHLGYTLQHRKRYSEAADCLRRALGIPYQGRHLRAKLLAVLAGDLYLSGKYRESLQACRESLELVPNEPKTLEALAKYLAICPDPQFRDPVEAVRLARRAVELSPQDRHIWRALAIAHYGAGNWRAVADAVEKDMELATSDAFDWLLLATAQSQLGNNDQARTLYDKAIAWMERNQSKDEWLGRVSSEAAGLLGLAEPSTSKAVVNAR